MRQRVLLPILVAALALVGALGAMVFLQRAASAALVRVQDERLRAAGESAAILLQASNTDSETLQRLVTSNGLDGAFLVDRSLDLLADSRGPAGARINLLRADPRRIDEAFQGRPTTTSSYSFGDLEVGVGYFPVRGSQAEVQAVLGLEAGETFAGPRRSLLNAFIAGCVLSLITALVLAFLAAEWIRADRIRQEASVQAIRGETMSRMAAIAAHEIRNPLGVIRGTVDLMRERKGQDAARDNAALTDIVSEVERLRQLTDDLLELSANRPLALTEVQLDVLLAEVGRAIETAFPSIRVALQCEPTPALQADGGRLRQVFLNLLTNAAQAQSTGTIDVSLAARGDSVRVLVRDQGPGIPEGLRLKLFDGTTTKETGNGLGLALSRRLIERHGGQLSLAQASSAGATFEVILPLQPKGSR
jgi:signal transduction histidine kinase